VVLQTPINHLARAQPKGRYNTILLCGAKKKYINPKFTINAYVEPYKEGKLQR
jgi:hypothetical protein